MRKTVIILCLLLTLTLFAEGWEKTGDFNLLLSQTYYSDNWDGTEMGNVNWTASFNFIMEKQLNKTLYDKNSLQLAFGQTHSQVRDAMNELYWQKPLISTDLIDYENMLTFTLQKFVDPFAAFRWESRFYDNTVPDDDFYLNPNILTFSLGARKILINQEIQNLETRLGAAYKQFLDQHADIDDNYNAGAEMVLSYWYTFPSKLGKFDSKLRLYQALLTSEDNGSDYWKAMDVEFVNNLTFKLSSYIGIKFYFEMLYDKEIDEDFRIKENLGINLSYTLF
ncbi:MAG: hypothetical protein K9N06_01900 [Candidatus Cloacimonetes bacterium]|nr:hypothetical protein [Candidatus Cloacimonadota bacterium]